jgi:hypothetical protein
MRLFKKSKEKTVQRGTDKLARGIANFIFRMQNGFANFMTRRTKNVSMSSMKAGLTIFCFFGFGLSIYFIVIAVLKKDSGKKLITIDRLSVPKYYNNNDNYTHPELLITKEQDEEMQAFRIYMDSLQRKDKHAYDSIIAFRPHLLDSVTMLEEMYNSQIQNKK